MSELVTPPGASGVKLFVKNAAGLPLAGAEVSVFGYDKTFVTNAEGRCEILQLGAGENTFTIEADGFKALTLKMELNTGTTSTKTVNMEPLFSGELNVGPVPAPAPTIVNADNA